MVCSVRVDFSLIEFSKYEQLCVVGGTENQHKTQDSGRAVSVYKNGHIDIYIDLSKSHFEELLQLFEKAIVSQRLLSLGVTLSLDSITLRHGYFDFLDGEDVFGFLSSIEM